MFEFLWKDSIPDAITWKRVAGVAVVGVLLTIAIVLGGSWFGHDLDPWLSLAVVLLFAMPSFVGNGRDTTTRMRWRR
jgi:predicted Na+-dependent transporter